MEKVAELRTTRQKIMAANPGLTERYAQKRFLKQGEVINAPQFDPGAQARPRIPGLPRRESPSGGENSAAAQTCIVSAAAA
jgi:hypothetical protein